MSEGICFREAYRLWREEKREQLREVAKSDEPLAHLLAVLDFSAGLLREIGSDGDAMVLEAHRTRLIMGKEWPGDPVKSSFPPSLSVADKQQHQGEEKR